MSATHIVKFWDPMEYPELAAKDVEDYFNGRSKYPDIGARMLAAWREGVSHCLNPGG